jgi:hypothetical protein
MGLVIVIVIVALPLAYMIWRFKKGDESVAGGSAGHQILGDDDEDWGPKS